MNALLVYDSWYGNTRHIAEAISQGLASNVISIDAHDALGMPLHDFDIVIVGSPTHNSMPTPAIQSFLNKIGDGELKGVYITAFDTRLTHRWLWLIGFAGRRIVVSLRGRGGCVITSPAGFYVLSDEGPIRSGEIAKAKRWAQSIAGIWQAKHGYMDLQSDLDTTRVPEVEAEA